MKQLPSQEFLRECFSYDSETGFLSWNDRPESHFSSVHQARIFYSKLAGKPVSRKANKGRLPRITINGLAYEQNRIVLALNGVVVPPGMDVDHINGNPFDNRIENLRLCTHQENCFNSKGKGAVLRGVRKSRAKHIDTFNARIKVRGEEIHLGNHPTKGLAAVAVAKASLRYFGRFSYVLNGSRFTNALTEGKGVYNMIP